MNVLQPQHAQDGVAQMCGHLGIGHVRIGRATTSVVLVKFRTEGGLDRAGAAGGTHEQIVVRDFDVDEAVGAQVRHD